MKKKLITILIVSSLLLVAYPAYAANVVVKDKPLQLDQPPIITNGRMFVPMRAIFEALGASVVYDQNSGVVTGTKNGKTVTIDQPYIVNGRTLVPLRYISETFGCKVDWLQTNQTAYIDSTIPKIENLTKSTPPVSVSQGYIHGNIKSHIYHLPGQASYNKISPGNLVYFNSEAEAQAAGYRRAKR